MNCFLAISNSPDLQVAFLNKIDNNLLDWTDDEVIKELYRMQIEIGVAFFYLPKDIARWEQFPPSCKWTIALLEKENVVANVLFTPADGTRGHLPEPNMFVGDFPNDIGYEKMIEPQKFFPKEYHREKITNSQIQLKWAKKKTPKFAMAVAKGEEDVWTYIPAPNYIMPYNRWMMRLINYCLHYDSEDFYQRYIK